MKTLGVSKHPLTRRAAGPLAILAALGLAACQTPNAGEASGFPDIAALISSPFDGRYDQVASIEPVAFRPDAALHAMERDLAERAVALSELDRRWQCVPFARELSGIEIHGNAWTWWGQAEDSYERGATPMVGAVLVLARTRHNAFGHVAVVREVVNAREIIVDHANWGWNAATRGRVNLGMHVMDVSENNDWSLTRFWSPVSEGWGSRNYPAYGFIYPVPRDDSFADTLVADAPQN